MMEDCSASDCETASDAEWSSRTLAISQSVRAITLPYRSYGRRLRQLQHRSNLQLRRIRADGRFVQVIDLRRKIRFPVQLHADLVEAVARSDFVFCVRIDAHL